MLKLRENVLELLDSHNYFDNLLIFDTDGRAVYYDSQGTSGIFGDIDVGKGWKGRLRIFSS